jgi:hypothetical protein
MKQITSYINDHLAGAVAALEMVDHLIKAHKGKPLEEFFATLEKEIEADRVTLQKLLGSTEARESSPRNMAAWIAEKFARSKFKVAGEQSGGLGLVQALETIELGIRGKQLLWRALSTSNWPAVRDVDLVQLEKRAVEQQGLVEKQRMEAARQAFAK